MRISIGLLILSILFTGCEKDEDNSIGSTNATPLTPSNPVPGKATTLVPLTTTLSWSCIDPEGDSLTYDVYFGTDSIPDNEELVAINQSQTTFDPGTLNINTTYYWKIVAKDDYDNKTEGPVWSFTTAWESGDPPINPRHGDEWTAYLGEDQIPLEMVFIEGGTFMMGAQEDESDASEYEFPRHQVTISEGFWIGKFEIRQIEWVAVNGDNPSAFYGYPNRPVEWISYNDIMNRFLLEFCIQWRLPTEAEWEYACRSGHDDSWFWWGSSYDDMGDYAWFRDNSDTGYGIQTNDVGGKIPNSWGLYDMHGNVRELCDDWFDSDYYETSPLIDPEGNDTGSRRVVRGGSWYEYPLELRSANRTSSPTTSRWRTSDIGFRIVREGF
ncbi:MAG: formylglycine-generating enzyme family protein [Candidatus Electryonea clarkiae]|nr:formylglycine-generating enzyme family protein [Candidatus Electryonea clarkiae]MDP8285170.1 formylglycine-generating enzyme family protein [Candidatus Electryonea clarkiae]